MKSFENVCILRPGKFNGYTYTKKEIKKMTFPSKALSIDIDFKHHPDFGVAYNFQKINASICCDVSFFEVVPIELLKCCALVCKITDSNTSLHIVTGMELLGVSLVANPADKRLVGNITQFRLLG